MPICWCKWDGNQALKVEKFFVFNTCCQLDSCQRRPTRHNRPGAGKPIAV
jgi:hypothetical protein